MRVTQKSSFTRISFHNTKKEFNKALLLLKLTICNFFENLIYFWVTLIKLNEKYRF